MGEHWSLWVAVVDDDPGACAGMARMLRAAGMRVDTYSSGEDFLVRRADESYDALVLDVRMPGMTGIELHRLLQERQIHVPVVYVTAHDDPQTREDARRQGCAGFFGKTESGRLVVDAIHQGTAQHRAAHPTPGS